jgi:sarcosine oxidase subunit alpha
VGSRRLPVGGRDIDRSSPIGFTFASEDMLGFAGDTLASALLGAGVDVVCRSPLRGRLRGVYSAGAEEPSAFVEITEPRFEPIIAATSVDLVDGLVAAGRPGVGRLAIDAGREVRVDHRHAHVETLVIGAGRSGVRAAGDADDDDRVMVADRRRHIAEDPSVTDPLVGRRDLTVLPSTSALGVYDDGYVVLHQRGAERDVVWHVRAGRVVLATGAHERPIAFSGNDRPGVMLASAALAYVVRFGVVPGERAVVFTTNHSAYDAASVLRAAGADVVAIADVAGRGRAGEDARADGFDVMSGWAVAGTDGDARVEAVHLLGPRGERRTVEADLVAVSGGWNPAVQLWRAIGGGLRYDDSLAAFVPDGDGPPWLNVTGRAAGDRLPSSVPHWYTPADDLSTHFVDLQRDATVRDVLDAVEDGLRSVEHVKRATYIGTAIDQGRTSGVLAAELVNVALGHELAAQGPTNARPPEVPVPFSALAGRRRGLRLDPVRRTPMHHLHVARGAVFEDVGQWKRPRYFPVGRLGAHTKEAMDVAVARECRAVREASGVLDASTLGKIEVVGPDAGTFLDRMYTNRMSTLDVGRIRYGLMLGLDGMVFDDGVAMRLAENHYLVTTTTGGAAQVLDRFEEWLQTEWPHLSVYCTSVTEQWAVAAVAGPNARDVVNAAGTDVNLAPTAFPFMTFREGSVAGVPARVARVSFTGELSYEVHVDARHGAHLWDAVLAAGEPFGLAAYGTEAMHVLRAEKGYVIVGQDTDGTVTPLDLGMSWIVRKDESDFVGRRSLRRSDTARADRKQLVGLLPVERDALLPEGAQLVARDTGTVPMPMIGHVTSSYTSAALDRTFALAMVERGRSMHGDHVHAPLPDRTIACEVVPPVFWDPEDERRDG